MTVEELLQNYGGNECVSIEGYCEEEHYDYFREVDEWELSDDNPNHYKPTCIVKEPWWNEVKDREIKEWNIIGGGMYKVELCIDLNDPEPTLLNHLLCWGYDPEDYLDTLDKIETAIKEKEYLAEHPEEADEEAQYLDDDIESWQEELKDMRADWKPEKEPNMDREIELIKKWVMKRNHWKR